LDGRPKEEYAVTFAGRLQHFQSLEGAPTIHGEMPVGVGRSVRVNLEFRGRFPERLLENRRHERESGLLRNE